jgi:hypothetical protein
MTDQYTSAFPPSLALHPGLQSFFQSFYKVSDDPSAHIAYADHFTEDAVVIMASKRVEGQAGK